MNFDVKMIPICFSKSYLFKVCIYAYFLLFIEMVIQLITSTIKYCATFFCAFYVYTKSQSNNISRPKFIVGTAISIILGFVACIFKLHFGFIQITLIHITLPLAYSLLYHIKLSHSFISSILSFGFSYASLMLACIPLTFIFNLLNMRFEEKPDKIILFSSIAAVQIIITVLSMKSKRMKRGLSYLIKGGSSDVGIYISAMIFLGIVLLSTTPYFYNVYAIPILLILVCSITLFFWRKNQITKMYIEQTKKQEIELLECAMQEKDNLIKALQADNENLSEIIHRDNKLIPAMIIAVKKHISKIGSTPEISDILMQLESICDGRMKAVKNYELTQKKQPSVGISSTDAIIFYMQQKAAASGVNFDLCVSADVNHMVEAVIDKDDLNTLLADLIENAIISTKKCSNKFVMASINVTDSIYSVTVHDSGENFAVEVLKNMGSKRITTHINDGGSGIGMMTTFRILNKYSAEFLIEEYSDSVNFSKKVEILFNGTNRRKIITPRHLELTDKLKHTAFVVLDK